MSLKSTPLRPQTRGTPPEEAPPQGTAPEETSPQETAPEETSPQETAPEETSPQETAPEETSPQETSPEVTPPQGTAPEGSPPNPSHVDTRFTVAAALRLGARTLRAQYGVLALASLGYHVLVIPIMITTPLAGSGLLIDTSTVTVINSITSLYSLGIMALVLCCMRGDKIRWQIMLQGFRCGLPLIGYYLLSLLIIDLVVYLTSSLVLLHISLSFLVCFLGIRLLLVPLLCIDPTAIALHRHGAMVASGANTERSCGLGLIDAIATSWQCTRGVFWRLFWMIIVLTVIWISVGVLMILFIGMKGVVGFMLLLFSVAWGWPWVMTTVAAAYTMLKGGTVPNRSLPPA